MPQVTTLWSTIDNCPVFCSTLYILRLRNFDEIISRLLRYVIIHCDPIEVTSKFKSI